MTMMTNKFWTAVSKALTAVTVMLIVMLVLASGAAASRYRILHQFRMPKDGSGPVGNLVMDAAGNLYGTTQVGGVNGGGTVFELSPTADGGWKEKILHNFGPLPTRLNQSFTDGFNPFAGLVFDAAGNLYGTTSGGGVYQSTGNSDGGIVFELSPTGGGSWTETILHAFGSGDDGAFPYGGLIFDAAGNLYGTTLYGGFTSTYCENSGGFPARTAFELSPTGSGSWTETILHFFGSGDDGALPFDSLIFDTAGNLYGTTGACDVAAFECGIVFELSPTGRELDREDSAYLHGHRRGIRLCRLDLRCCRQSLRHDGGRRPWGWSVFS